MKKLLVSGSIAYDMIMQFDGKFSDHILKDQLENLNVWFTISHLEKSNGGTAHNIAYSLGLLGLKNDTIMLAAVGKDFVPEEKLSVYIDYARILKDSDLFTPCAYIITDNQHNQITPFYPWALMSAAKQHIPEWDIEYAMIAPNAKDAMLIQLKECKEKWIKCFFDPGQAMTLFGKEDLMHALEAANYLICNEYEFWWILEKTWLSNNEIMASLDKMVITLWKNGVKLIDKDWELLVPTKIVEHPVDPTGAWDAFRAGLLKWLFEWKSWEDSAKIGNAVAAYAVQSQWWMNHVFNLEDINI